MRPINLHQLQLRKRRWKVCNKLKMNRISRGATIHRPASELKQVSKQHFRRKWLSRILWRNSSLRIGFWTKKELASKIKWEEKGTLCIREAAWDLSSWWNYHKTNFQWIEDNNTKVGFLKSEVFLNGFQQNLSLKAHSQDTTMRREKILIIILMTLSLESASVAELTQCTKILQSNLFHRFNLFNSLLV